MTKFVTPAGKTKHFNLKCHHAASLWKELHPSDPFAFGTMFADLINGLETYGSPDEVINDCAGKLSKQAKGRKANGKLTREGIDT